MNFRVPIAIVDGNQYTPSEFAEKPELINKVKKRAGNLRLECIDGCELIFKNGEKIASHFAHKTESHATSCRVVQKYGKRGESIEHYTAKMMIARESVLFVRPCWHPRCSSERVFSIPPGLNAKVEVPLTTEDQRVFIADVVFFDSKGDIKYVVEVKHTHAVDSEKLKWLLEQPFKFIEARTNDELDHTEYTVVDTYNKYYCNGNKCNQGDAIIREEKRKEELRRSEEKRKEEYKRKTLQEYYEYLTSGEVYLGDISYNYHMSDVDIAPICDFLAEKTGRDIPSYIVRWVFKERPHLFAVASGQRLQKAEQHREREKESESESELESDNDAARRTANDDYVWDFISSLSLCMENWRTPRQIACMFKSSKEYQYDSRYWDKEGLLISTIIRVRDVCIDIDRRIQLMWDWLLGKEDLTSTALQLKTMWNKHYFCRAIHVDEFTKMLRTNPILKKRRREQIEEKKMKRQRVL